MLVYRLYKSAYIADPLSAEGARRAGGRWNPKGFGNGRPPILYTSATPELALLEVIAHLNPTFIPNFYLLVLEVPNPILTVSLTKLPADWRDDDQYEPLQTYLSDWMTQPDGLCVAFPLSIVPGQPTICCIHCTRALLIRSELSKTKRLRLIRGCMESGREP